MYGFNISREKFNLLNEEKTEKRKNTHNKWKMWYKMAEISPNLMIIKNPNGLNLPIWKETPTSD